MLSSIKKWFAPPTPQLTLNSVFGSHYNPVTPRSILGNPAVFRAVDLISTSIAKIPFDVYRKTSNGRVIADDHAAYDLIKLRPNSFYSKFQLVKSWVVSALTHGDGYIWINRDSNGDPIELILLDSSQVTVAIEQDRLIYAVVDSSGINRIDSSNILHLRGLGTDGITGLPVCNILGEAFKLGNTLQRYTSVFFEQGSRPNLLIKLPPEISGPEQVETFRKEFGSVHGGLDNAFRPALIRPGMEVTPLASDTAVEQLTNLREHDLVMIANIFGIPPHKVGAKSNSVSYGSLEQENRSFIDDLDGFICQIEMEMSIKLLRNDEYKTMYFEGNRDARIQTDSKTKAELAAIYRRNGLMSDEELRKMLNKPVDFNGQFWTEANLISRDKALLPDPEPEPQQEPDKTEQLAKKMTSSIVNRLVRRAEKSGKFDLELWQLELGEHVGFDNLELPVDEFEFALPEQRKQITLGLSDKLTEVLWTKA